MSPEEFKLYNEAKKKEIAALRNSSDKSADVQPVPPTKGARAMKIMDVLFGRKNGKLEKIENAKEIGQVEVALGKNRRVTVAELIKNAAKLNDEDYDKLMKDEDERPDLENDDEEDKDKLKMSSADEDEDLENDDEEDEKAKLKNKKKNRQKSSKDEDKEDVENEEKDGRPDLENDDDDEELKNKKKNRKKSSKDEDELKNDDEFEGRGTDGEKDFVGNDEDSPLKHVIMLDGEETTVGDMINAHLDLKGKHNSLREKHNALKEKYSAMCNKFGDDDEYGNDMEIPEDDAEMQAALGRMEDEEGNLEKALEVRKNAITKVLDKMKNSAELKAKREEKATEKKQAFERLKNAELEAMLHSKDVVAISTDTSASMVARGKSRYGSTN